jgi:hypothetical protein
MREPHFMDLDTGVETPYSAASLGDLMSVITGTAGLGPNPNEVEFWDGDFRRWYASYLLSQRSSS